uniref:Uncharacterized protein n=1 Tax=Utricularia reniformis TaxID=192314 RepID=A0A1Y0B1L1_9LAMI|nr:hypothetical protein AEK19_MT1078 [Utricularia reniformis]ART31300.1 hypothetical protein AEK19_MT1078 [Utricularia reniformis]
MRRYVNSHVVLSKPNFTEENLVEVLTSGMKEECWASVAAAGLTTEDEINVISCSTRRLKL